MLLLSFKRIRRLALSGNYLRCIKLGCVIAVLFTICLGSDVYGQNNWLQAEKITASDGEAGDQFGHSVSIGGSAAAVGAPFADSPEGGGTGAAYLYDSRTGEEIRKLWMRNGSEGDLFGFAVASGELFVAVGMPLDDENGEDSGSVHIFSAITGDALGTLYPNEPQVGETFGAALSISPKGFLLIGAPFSNQGAESSGAVYLFDLLTMKQVKKFVAPEGPAREFFGTSVHLDTVFGVAGAPQSDPDNPGTGKAYVFSLISGDVVGVLEASDKEIEDAFGQTVVSDGTRIIVGASHANHHGEDSGAVYVYDAETFEELNILHASNATAGTYFGRALDIERSILAVGAGSPDESGGVVYLFDAETGDEFAGLVPDDRQPNDNFGMSVSIHDNTLLSGAYLADDNGEDSGAAYFYREEIVNTLVVSPLPLVGGERVLFEIDFEDRLQWRTWLLYSLTGDDPTHIQKLGIIVNLTIPQLAFGPTATDDEGDLVLEFPVPGVNHSTPIWFQVVQNGRVTNNVATEIVPGK